MGSYFVIITPFWRTRDNKVEQTCVYRASCLVVLAYQECNCEEKCLIIWSEEESYLRLCGVFSHKNNVLLIHLRASSCWTSCVDIAWVALRCVLRFAFLRSVVRCAQCAVRERGASRFYVFITILVFIILCESPHVRMGNQAIFRFLTRKRK